MKKESKAFTVAKYVIGTFFDVCDKLHVYKLFGN